MREKYKNNVAWLFKRKIIDNTPTYEVDGIPFYCNKETRKRSVLSPMSNTFKSVTTEVYKTTTQLDFAENDKIAFTQTPINDATTADFTIIIAVDEKPYLEKGNKQRTVTYKEFWLTLS